VTSSYAGDLFALFAFGGFWFCVGVGFAAYRAVGWVERMKSWAGAVMIADEEIDEMGVN